MLWCSLNKRTSTQSVWKHDHHFFAKARRTLYEKKVSEYYCWYRSVVRILALRTTLFYINWFIYSWLCENRQQPTWILRRNARKMAYMRVCSAFFFCAQLCWWWYNVACKKCCDYSAGLRHNTVFFIFCKCLFMLCENRQQPTWILREKVVKRWCTCVCAPHFFFFYAQLCKLKKSLISKIVKLSNGSATHY